MARAFGAATFEEERSLVLGKLASLAAAKGRATRRHLIREIYSEFQESSSPELRNDFDVILAAVVAPPTPESGSALRYASEELRGRREIVLEAVKTQGLAIQHASAELRDDKELVLAAMECNYWAFIHASEALRGDRDVAMMALRKQSEEARDQSPDRTGSLLRFVHRELRGDADIVMQAVVFSGSAMRFASDHLRQDKDVILRGYRTALSDSREACYQEAHAQLKDTWTLQEFALIADSKLALAGESSPVLSVVVGVAPAAAPASGSDPNSDLCSDSTPKIDPAAGPAERHHRVRLRCDVALLSGSTFTVWLPDENDSWEDTTTTTDPTVGQLAEKLVKELAMRSSEANAPNRVFVVIKMNENESLCMTPWDCARSLAEFV